MARINIEDELWTDARFLALASVLGKWAAMGVMVEIFKVAQGFWVQGKLIPADIWGYYHFPPQIESVGLITRRDEGIYVHGSEKQFAWLVQRSNAGKQRKGSKGRNQYSEPKEIADIVQTERFRNANGTLSECLPQSQSQSLKKEEETKNKENTLDQIFGKPKSPAYRPKFDFESVYQRYPRKVGKSKGLKVCERQIKTPEDYDQLSTAVDRYSNYCDAQYSEARFVMHFSTFMNSWRDWLDPTAGTAAKVGSGSGIDWDEFLKRNSGPSSPKETG